MRECEEIAKTLKSIAEDYLCSCPECDEYYYVGDSMVIDSIFCPNCGEELEEQHFVMVQDYLSDWIDIEYTVDAERKYKGVKVMIAWGGPDIYINTNTCAIEMCWWDKKDYYPITGLVTDMVDEMFQDIYEGGM